MKTEDLNIVSVFIAVAKKHPEATALRHDGAGISYSRLLLEVRQTAAGFLDKGIKPGDKVLVFVPMSIDLYRIVLALFYIGASPVFLDAWVSFRRLRECCEVVPCQALIAPPRLLWLAFFIKSLRRIPVRLSSRFSGNNKAADGPFPTRASSTALVTFTTGTTGTPKAADRTHAYLAAQLTALTPLIPDDATSILSTLPVVVLINLALGKTTVLPPGSYSMKKARTAGFLANLIRQEALNALIVSPAVIEQLCDFDLPLVRHIITGGGPVYPVLAGKVSERFPAAAMTIVFGSTEAEPISHLSGYALRQFTPEHVANAGLPVGRPDIHAHVVIIPFSYQPSGGHTEAEWQSIVCNTGEPGEIVVSGNHVLKHYLNNAAAEAIYKIQVAGTTWHRTGDAGRLDANGALYFMGRCNEVIEWNGRQLFPALIAYQFCVMARVQAAAILKISDRLLLVIESGKPLSREIMTAVPGACGIADATVIYLKKIPKDPRHQTKTDYERLHKLLASVNTRYNKSRI